MRFEGALMPMTSGINLGWSSPYLPILEDGSSIVKLSETQASWFAVTALAGSPFGALLGALFVDKIGRKNLLLIQAPLIALAFGAIAYAKHFIVLFVARFIIGATEGAIYTALPIYYGEIADPEIRGLLGSSISVAALIGTLFINSIGPFMSIHASGLVCVLIPILNLITFVWLPESPYYLIKKARYVEARKSLIILRGREDVSHEFDEIVSAVKRQESASKEGFLDLVTVKSNRNAVFIYVILAFTNKFSGMVPVVFYTWRIFQTAGGDIDPLISVIAFSSVGVTATCLAVGLIDKFGRRPLMLFSALGCSICLAAEATYFTLQIYNPTCLSYLGWLPVTALLTYNVCFCFGLSYGPVLCLSELFPTSVKANALGMAETVSVIFAIAASQFFHALTVNFGMYVPFWCFAVCSMFGGYLLYATVLETKGKTLEQIQLELINKNK